MRYPAAAVIALPAVMIIVILASVCLACAPNPLQGGIKVYSGDKAPEEAQPSQVPPAATPPPAPVSDTKERHETVTDANSVFSIGLPPGYREERQVSAQKPVDFWFEYLTPDMSLTLNGVPVEIPVRRGTGKAGFTSGVTAFSYVMSNASGQYLSYNLRIAPSKQGEAVNIVTRETWTAP